MLLLPLLPICFFLLYLFDVLFLVGVVFCSSDLSAVPLRPIDFQLKKAHFSLIADFAKVVAFFLHFRSRCLLFYAAFFLFIFLISLFCCCFFLFTKYDKCVAVQ